MGIVGLLLVVVFLLFSISRTLFRLEQQGGVRETQVIHKSDGAAGQSSGPSPAMIRKITKESDFMTFLSEDAARKTLPKREQFAAYREWRQRRGLNWPHELPGEDSDPEEVA